MDISNLSVSSNEFEDRLLEDHFISYQDYYEWVLLKNPDEDSFCYRCNKDLEPLTYLDPSFYYIPCLDCAKKKTNRDLIYETIIKNIKNYYTRLIGDRYLQLFIVDDIYYRTTLTHNYDDFKDIINSLDPPSRNDIWFLDWNIGYPKIISEDNRNGLKIVNITKLYSDKISVNEKFIKVGDYEINMPEIIDLDSKRQSRYSVFNKNGDRKRKRVKIGDKCVKLYNTDDDDIKSIFKLTKNGNDVALRSITHQDYVIIKLLIMRNKNFMRVVFDIIMELCKGSGILRDSVFLRNTIKINPNKDVCLNILWNSISEYKRDDYINISII